MSIQLWCIFCNSWPLVKSITSDFKLLWWFCTISRQIHHMLFGPLKCPNMYVHILKDQLPGRRWRMETGKSFHRARFNGYLFDVLLIYVVTNLFFPWNFRETGLTFQSKTRRKYIPIGLYLPDFYAWEI